MKATHVFIDRPIFAAMIIMAMVVLGLFSFRELGVDLFPSVEFPVVTITTALPGASPEEIETEVTKKIEEQINTISGVDELQSFSYDGVSLVMARFILEKKGDVAAEEVRDRINRVAGEFPFGTNPPVVEKFETTSAPIMQIVISGNLPIRDLTEITRKKAKEVLETVNGVGNIAMAGGREREIHILIDPARLAARNLSVTDIEIALRKQNMELPGGRITEEPRELIVRTMGKITDVKDFETIPIAVQNGTPIFLRDVAGADDTEEEPRSFSRLNGTSAITLIVRKQSGTNTVAVAESLRARLKEIGKTLPPEMKTEIIQDTSLFVMEAVHSLEKDILLGAILVALTVLLFLRNFRGMLICAVSIPISLISTFTMMRWMGFTLNNLTLLALSLATGIVIDDAIIVLENIFRHVEELKESPKEAASKALGEIGLAVVSTTLSLMVIFVPLAFMRGIVGRFMFSFGVTMAFAIGVSLVVAFVLTPMMSSRILKEKNVAIRSSRETKINRFLDKHYTGMLKWVLGHRKVAVISAVIVMFLSVPAIIFVGKDFMPRDDRSEFSVQVKAPQGTSIEEMDRIMENIEGKLRGVKGVANLLTSVGSGANKAVNEGDVFVKLIDLKKRSYSQRDVMADVRKVLAGHPTLRTSVLEGGGAGGAMAGFQMRLTGPSLEKLQEYAALLMDEMKNKDGFVDVNTTFEFGKPEVRVKIDRDRAADLGVTADDIAGALQLFVSGEKDITRYKIGDELYEVRVRLEEQYRKRPSDLLALTIPVSLNNKGEKPRNPVRLDQVASIEETTGPSQIERYQRQRTIEINANLIGMPTNAAKKFVMEKAGELSMPPGYEVEFVGFAKFMGEMQTNFVLAFILSFIFMYMILASLFESLLHPVTILISLPLTFPFAVLSLLAAHKTLHIISILGLFLLIGIVKKNSILQVDYTNTLRARGVNRYDALIEASRTRLRPIMMTTMTLIASMIPVALATGPGSATRAPMAVVIIGGQALSLIISLLLTPVFYSIFDDIQKKWKF